MKPVLLIAAASAGIAGCTDRGPSVSSAPSVLTAPADKPAAGPEMEIIRMVGRHQTIVVTTGPHGPLYSANTADGQTIVAKATLDELRNKHPDVYWAIERSVTVDEASSMR